MHDPACPLRRQTVWSCVLAVAFFALGIVLMVGFALPARHDDVLVACGTALLAVTSVVLAGAFATTAALVAHHHR